MASKVRSEWPAEVQPGGAGKTRRPVWGGERRCSGRPGIVDEHRSIAQTHLDSRRWRRSATDLCCGLANQVRARVYRRGLDGWLVGVQRVDEPRLSKGSDVTQAQCRTRRQRDGTLNALLVSLHSHHPSAGSCAPWPLRPCASRCGRSMSHRAQTGDSTVAHHLLCLVEAPCWATPRPWLGGTPRRLAATTAADWLCGHPAMPAMSCPCSLLATAPSRMQARVISQHARVKAGWCAV